MRPGPVGFENHVNYIHVNGLDLMRSMAKGLWARTRSALDLYFRQFNGQTQVNATDLRNVRFPHGYPLRGWDRIGDEPCTGAIDKIVTRS